MIISPNFAGAYRIRVKNTRTLNRSVRIRRMFNKEEKIKALDQNGYIYKNMYFHEMQILNRESDIEIQKGRDWVLVEIGTSEDKFVNLLKEISAYLDSEIEKYKNPPTPEYSCELNEEKPPTHTFEQLPSDEHDTDPKNREILKGIVNDANNAIEGKTRSVEEVANPIATETIPIIVENPSEPKELEEEIMEHDNRIIKPVIQQNNNQIHPNINNRPQYNGNNKHKK